MELEAFQRTLSQHPEAAIELSDDTRDRYRRGEVPKVVRWLVRHPALLAALLKDAEARQSITEEIA